MTIAERAPAPPVSAPTARDQEVIVRYLAERTRAKLAGDAPEMAVICEQRPSQVLQLGVLPPLPAPDPASGMTAEQLARELRRPPSHIGVTFTLRPDEGAERVTVELETDFLCYVQRYPDLATQRAHQGAQAADDDGDGNGHGAQAGPRTSLFERYERHHIATDRIALELDLTRPTGKRTYPIDDSIAAALGPVLAERETVYPFSAQTGMKLAVSATQGSDAEYWAAIAAAEHPRARADKPHKPPTGLVEVAWRRLADGSMRVHATLHNTTVEPPRSGRTPAGEVPRLYRDLHFFNAKLRVYETDTPVAQTEFRETPEGFRYDKLRKVDATGINCVARRADAAEDAERPLLTETWPLYRQVRILQNEDPELRMTFDELRGPGARKALARIGQGLEDYEAAWRRALADWDNAATYDQAERAREQFIERDIAMFKRGMRCLADDDRLLAAFRAANEVFYRIDQAKPEHKRFGAWRLFQVVFQVGQLPALRARELNPAADPELAAELDTVDVLHFNTGGGKTEAYLGLIVMALFYDRLRGKQRGVTAVLRFPLRMLSVQQLQRILDVLWWSERYRRELVEKKVTVAGGDYRGDEFLLGYWVGRQNTPNSLVDTRPEHERDNIDWWANLIRTDSDEAANRRIVTLCPNPACDDPDKPVVLRADPDRVRLHHTCSNCGEDLPVVISDDEVYRYLPGVLVATVDKLAHLARADQFVGVFAGPAFACPKHGYFNNHTAVFKNKTVERDDRCLAGGRCDVDPADYVAVGATHDPPPSLHVQDELHLLEEELGSLDAHYETLFEVLATDLGGRGPKMLAATATIEKYAEQVRQLYARDARVFPSQGWELGESFYIHTTDAARRLYVGALPYRTDPAEFGERVQAYLHEEVIAMQADPAAALGTLVDHGLDGGRDADWLEAQLLNYELTLGYVNRKQDAERIAMLLGRREFGPAQEKLTPEVLVADHTTLGRIAWVLNRIDEQYDDATPRTERLRALEATSLVSHGVDLDPLNLMVMNGMTPSVAGYVQASSRSGRTHVGLVVVGYDRRKARERSFYQYFLKYHEFLDRLITPVPVNRFAKFAARWTLPGVVSALLVQAYQRERALAAGLNPAKPSGKTLSLGAEVRKWVGAPTQPPTGVDKQQHLHERVLRALGVGKHVLRPTDDGNWERQPVFDPVWEDSLREAVREEFKRQLSRLLDDSASKSGTPDRMSPSPLGSFRSVEEPLTFQAHGNATTVEMDLTTAREKSAERRKRAAAAKSKGS